MNWRDIAVWSETLPQYPQNSQIPTRSSETCHLDWLMNELGIDQLTIEDAASESPKTVKGRAIQHQAAGYMVLSGICSKEELLEELHLCAKEEPKRLLYYIGMSEGRLPAPTP